MEHGDWGLVQSLRVHYDDGLEVEFGLAPTDWATPPIDVRTAAVIRDGLAPVWDPDAWFTRALDAVAADVDQGDDGAGGLEAPR